MCGINKEKRWTEKKTRLLAISMFAVIGVYRIVGDIAIAIKLRQF